MLISTNVTADTYYFHNDQLGTPQVVTDNAQQVVWKGEYDPFGKATEAVVLVEQNVRFPGQYFDQETGLHYNYFRTYDPRTGRYLESDPIGLGGGINTFLYAGADPITQYDRYGLFNDSIYGFIYRTTRYSPSQNVVNGSAGLGDGLLSAVSFGLISGQRLRDSAKVGGVDSCSAEYRRGKLAGVSVGSLAAPAARLSYLNQISKIPGVARNAQHAVSLRNKIKSSHRQPFAKLLDKWHKDTYSSLTRKKSDADIILGAGRGNKVWTEGIIASGVVWSGIRTGIEASNQAMECGC